MANKEIKMIVINDKLKDVVMRNFSQYLMLNYSCPLKSGHERMINAWFNNCLKFEKEFPNYDYAFNDFLDYFKGCVFVMD